MSSLEAVILIGIQAAGKSTFYQQRFANTHLRLNLDMLKTRHRERILLEACIEAKQSFVVDNTNVTRLDRARYIGLAKPAGFRIVGYSFQSSVADAIQRNRKRRLAKPIPPVAIAGTQKRLEAPSWDEGFDELYSVQLDPSGGFILEKWNNDLR